MDPKEFTDAIRWHLVWHGWKYSIVLAILVGTGIYLIT